MVEKLTKVWEKLGTVELAIIFENYMLKIGAKKADRRRKDNGNTYMIDGESTGWNRVQCYYHKDNLLNYCEENLLLVLRKESGDYFIVQRKNERAFEVDYRGVQHYDKKLLNEIVEEHKPLFDTLFKTVS